VREWGGGGEGEQGKDSVASCGLGNWKGGGGKRLKWAGKVCLDKG
jgi:hypothetical protein